MRNAAQVIPDHAAILATFARSVPLAGPPPPGAVVRLSGPVGPGPNGVLQAPFSGRPCVWFRAVEFSFRKFGPLEWQAYVGRPNIPLLLGSDVGYAHGDGRVDHESEAPFTVTTDAGPVLVDPVRADVHASTVSFHGEEGEYRFTTFVIRHEWILEPGTPLFVLGPAAPAQDGVVLRAGPADCLVVSDAGEQAAAARSQGAVAAAPVVAGSGRIALVVGLSIGVVALVVMIVLALSLVG